MLLFPNVGNSWVSFGQIDVKIFKKICYYWLEMAAEAGVGSKFHH